MVPNYICLSIDGLQCGMIGAFGNTWIHTPTLDALACQSALFDRFYASTTNLSATLAEWWVLPNDCHKILLTDDADVFLHEQASLFDEKHQLETKQQNQPSVNLEATQFFRNMATIVDLLRNQQSDKRFLLWAHFRGFCGTWDFPLSFRKRYQIDEDPDPYAGMTLPDVANDHIADKNIDPNVVQSVREAYSGGVTVLDDALSGLLEFLNESGLEQNTILLFTSTSGFSLGEHNRIGTNTELYGENIHLPLFIRFPNEEFAGFRSQTLLQPCDIFSLLTKENLPEEPDDVHSSLYISSKMIDDQVIVTPDWLIYQKFAKHELYVKPDDLWEVNDVADRCSQVLEEHLLHKKEADKLAEENLPSS